MRARTKKRLCVAGIVLGVLLCLAPVFGMVGSVMGMTQAFEVLGHKGVNDPKQLSEAIGTTLHSTAWGIFLAPFGLALLILCVIVRFQIREEAPPPIPQ